MNEEDQVKRSTKRSWDGTGPTGGSEKKPPQTNQGSNDKSAQER